MAKKEANLFTFKDVLSGLDSAFKSTATIRETINSSKKRGTISTGIYVLNAALSGSLYGGIQDNRITIFGGESGVGKSYLCFNVAREAQQKGYMIIYIDTEYAIELDQLENYGIDISEDKFVLMRNNIIEDLKVGIARFLDTLKSAKEEGKELPKLLFILDSIGQMGSRKETEDALAGKEKADMTRAKALGSMFRIINSDLGYLGYPLLCSNHTYQCVTGDTLIKMSDNTNKQIKDIEKGEYVKTLSGDKEVNFITKYNDAVIFQITLEDGKIIKCTNEHKFLIKKEWSEDENDECWINAQDLKENDIILAIS